MSDEYWSVYCDGCNCTNLPRFRFKCLRCEDYDLCDACHEKKVVTGEEHQVTHPFQCLLDIPTKELLFAGERIPTLEADSFTCPVCGEHGHSASKLIQHAATKHKGDTTLVICPLCVAVHGADPLLVANFYAHLTRFHGPTDRTGRYNARQR